MTSLSDQLVWMLQRDIVTPDDMQRACTHIGTTYAGQECERSREIAEVEPVAPCREISAGTAYSCRLLVERNDPLMAAIGADTSTILEGDFVFERDGATGPWRMAEGFHTTFAKSAASGRTKDVTQ